MSDDEKTCIHCGHDHSGRRPDFPSTCDWALIPWPGPADFCRCKNYEPAEETP